MDELIFYHYNDYYNSINGVSFHFHYAISSFRFNNIDIFTKCFQLLHFELLLVLRYLSSDPKNVIFGLKLTEKVVVAV